MTNDTYRNIHVDNLDIDIDYDGDNNDADDVGCLSFRQAAPILALALNMMKKTNYDDGDNGC